MWMGLWSSWFATWLSLFMERNFMVWFVYIVLPLLLSSFNFAAHWRYPHCYPLSGLLSQICFISWYMRCCKLNFKLIIGSTKETPRPRRSTLYTWLKKFVTIVFFVLLSFYFARKRHICIFQTLNSPSQWLTCLHKLKRKVYTDRPKILSIYEHKSVLQTYSLACD